MGREETPASPLLAAEKTSILWIASTQPKPASFLAPASEPCHGGRHRIKALPMSQRNIYTSYF
jgi:hypothetical protein